MHEKARRGASHADRITLNGSIMVIWDCRLRKLVSHCRKSFVVASIAHMLSLSLRWSHWFPAMHTRINPLQRRRARTHTLHTTAHAFRSVHLFLKAELKAKYNQQQWPNAIERTFITHIESVSQHMNKQFRWFSVFGPWLTFAFCCSVQTNSAAVVLTAYLETALEYIF